MSGRNSQVIRIYKILNLLEGAPQGLTVGEIESRLKERGLEVSKRTIYRDLDAISEIGFPLTEEKGIDENANRFILQENTRINGTLVLSIKELFALFLARGMLKPLEGTPFYDDLTSVFSKIEEKLGTRQKSYLKDFQSEWSFEPGPKWGLGLDPDLLETVRACCAEKQILEVQYASASSQRTTKRRLGPHFLYFAKGSLYLVAEDLGDKKVKVFSCPRMKDAKMLNIAYEGEPIDPEKYFKHSFGIFQSGSPAQIKIKFSATIAPFICERQWHKSQRVVKKGDGSIILSLEAAITPELIGWVLSYGSNAYVIEPEELKIRVKEEAQNALSQYLKKAA